MTPLPMFHPENPLVWVLRSPDAPTGDGTRFHFRKLVVGPRIDGRGRDARPFLVALKITPQRRFWESVGKMVLGEWWHFSSVSGGAAEASAVLA